MKRSSKALVNAAKLQTERDKVFSDNQERMLKILEGIQQSMQRMECQLAMRKKVDLTKYIPINSLSDVRNFLNKSDGDFHLRREEFENFLFCTVTNTIKLKRSFESNLLGAIFSRDFMSSHKWPGQGYIIFLGSKKN